MGHNEQTENTTLPTAIGQAYGGGFYVGKTKDGEKTYLLIAAPKKDGEAEKPWASLATGVTSTTDGFGNTAALVNNCNLRHDAAIFCNDLTIGGYDDWYLPAKDELAVMLDAGKALAAIGEGFESYYYWSASEYSAANAWFQHWYSSNPGFQDYTNKTSAYYVRAVRRLEI